MNKRIEIILSGGWHECPETKVYLTTGNERQEKALQKRLGWVMNGDMEVWEVIDIYCSASQKRRLNRHFCGSSDCKCGGYHNYSLDIECDLSQFNKQEEIVM